MRSVPESSVWRHIEVLKSRLPGAEGLGWKSCGKLYEGGRERRDEARGQAVDRDWMLQRVDQAWGGYRVSQDWIPTAFCLPRLT